MKTAAWLSILLSLFGCPDEDGDDTPPPPNPDASEPPPDIFPNILAGLELYVASGCAACHCNSAEGGCNAAAPGIVNASYAALDGNLRFASTADEVAGPDPWDPHPLKTTGATDQDIQNLAYYLASLDPKEPFDGSGSLIAEGYDHYVSGACISCHLTSGQGSATGGIGAPISGSNASAENLFTALSGGVNCHPLQCVRAPGATECEAPPAMSCSLTGRVESNATVELLTELGEDGERARSVLAYFLSFIAPPPVGGEVEPCDNVSGQMCTLAGNGIGGFTRDEVPAIETLLYYPAQLDFTDWNKDGSLDLAVVDFNNHRIRVIYLDKEFTYGNPEKTGIDEIVSIAGDGKVTGDDALNHPTDLAFDPDGNLWLAGWHNQNIYRYINPLNPQTVSNGGGGGRRLPRDQPIGICDLACRPDGMPVRQNPVGLPTSIVVHPSGEVIFGENNCMRIRGLTVTGTPSVYRPVLCNDPARIFEESTYRTIAGAFPPGAGYEGDGGPATEARFNVFRGPTVLNFGIAIEPGANPERIYIADSFNNVIRYLDLTAQPVTIHHYAGVLPCADPQQQLRSPCNLGHRDAERADALFNFPQALFVDAQRNLYVAEGRNHDVRRIDFATGRVTTIAGTPPRAGFNGDNQPATSAALNGPAGVAVHPDGRIFITDQNNNRIRYIVP
jgi:DNA-binding beta-propeller fold protein YncE